MNTKENKQKIYNEIVDLIYTHGKTHSKKHGKWYIAPYTNSSWIEMDSWNKRIVVFEGEPQQDSEIIYWSGFSSNSKNKRYLGIDFGGFECVEDIDFYLNILKAALNEQQLNKQGMRIV